MPYIKKTQRDKILETVELFDDRKTFHNKVKVSNEEKELHYIVAENIETPGDLNYAISLLAGLYVKRKGMSYTVASEALSAMEGAKLEFYRRVLAPYENKKIKENGDVYPPEIMTK